VRWLALTSSCSEDHPRDPEVGGDLPDHLRLHFHAVDGAHDEHRGIGHSQRREDIADESA
jgi:hypothetical protein